MKSTPIMTVYICSIYTVCTAYTYSRGYSNWKFSVISIIFLGLMKVWSLILTEKTFTAATAAERRLVLFSFLHFFTATKQTVAATMAPIARHLDKIMKDKKTRKQCNFLLRIFNLMPFLSQILGFFMTYTGFLQGLKFTNPNLRP